MTDAMTGPGAPGPPQRLVVEVGNASPLLVHVRSGAQVRASTRILVVMHGAERQPLRYLAAWEPLIEGRDVLLLAPEFGVRQYPEVDDYNLGGMRHATEDRPAEERTFAAIGRIVDAARAILGVRSTDVDLFGHSAGAQFVHRYLTFTPGAPVRRAVVANAGWYTLPDGSVDFPYGLRNAPEPRASLDGLLGTDLIILLGERDTDTEALRRDDGARRQGATRLARGMSYFAAGRDLASSRGVQFSWRLETVPGVGHDQTGMAAAASAYLLPERRGPV